MLLVVHPDGRDRGDDGGNDVRCVEAAAEPDLNHRHLDTGAAEHLEGHRGGHFEERWRDGQRAVRLQSIDARRVHRRQFAAECADRRVTRR